MDFHHGLLALYASLHNPGGTRQKHLIHRWATAIVVCKSWCPEMMVKSHVGAGHVGGHAKPRSHPARTWLRSLVRPVSRAGRRFWIPFIIACVSVTVLENRFERLVQSEEYPGFVQTVFHLTGLYQWLVARVRFPYPRYTAIVAIDPDKEPDIPSHNQICRQRKVVAELLCRVHAASPAVIVVDKYFGTRDKCSDETADLRRAIETVTRDTVVVVGRRIDDNVVSTKAGDRHFLQPSVDFGIQSPRFQQAIVNVDPDTRKIPLGWESYESREKAEKSTGLPAWHNTVPLQASLAHPGRLLQHNRRISSFIQRGQDSFTSFLKADEFEPILAGRILSSGVPGGTAQACPSEPLPEDLRQQIAGRVVLIGEVDHDLDDHLTVVGRMSGLLLQANYIEALLDDRVFRPVPILDYVFGFLILAGLELTLIVFRGRWVWLALALVVLFVFSSIVLSLFVQLLGWYVDPTPLSIIAVVTKILGSFFGRAEEETDPGRPPRRKRPA